ncbi:phosphate ABC transporter substrate-binding protein [Aliagarivorans marinus]|uniref:phosphate ABC transporter substrate-binding protein n=1 Tax=Aliagarivorans marinus TaxID=561965 RepID=UPI0005511D12|nr:phosphate ABC transporter substrate-binding protein [Aliagarivorans marinus]
MIKRILLIASLMMATCGISYAEVAVIVNSANGASIDQGDIKKLFLGKAKKFSDGSSATPVNLPANSALREAFDNQALGKSPQQMKSYWSKLIFTGKGQPPEELADDAAVIQWVTSNADAIGYIDAASATADVKVIATY